MTEMMPLAFSGPAEMSVWPTGVTVDIEKLDRLPAEFGSLPDSCRRWRKSYMAVGGFG